MNIKKDAILIPIAKIYFMVIGYAIMMIMGHFLPKNMLGVYHYLNSVISPINMILIQGGVQSTSHFVSKDFENRKKYLKFGLKVFSLISIVLFTIFQIFATSISKLFTKNSDYSIYFRVGSLIFLFYALYSVSIGYINGKKEFKKQALFDISYSSIKFFLILIPFILGGGLLSAISGWAAATFVITSVALFIVLKDKISDNFLSESDKLSSKITLQKKFMKYMLPIILYQGAFYILLNLDTWILGALSSTESALSNGGDYLTINTISRIPFQATLSLTFILFPHFSSEKNSEITKSIEKSLKFAILFVGFFVFPILWSPRFFLILMYGKKYIDNDRMLMILSFGTLFLSLFVVANTIIAAIGRAKTALIFTLFSVFISLTLNSILISKYSIQGAAIGSSISFFISFLIVFIYLKIKYRVQIELRYVFGTIFGIFLASFIGLNFSIHSFLGGFLTLLPLGVIYLIAIFVAFKKYKKIKSTK
ncbi:polysaccharide biosynthesis C-terminal domain-containing protein [bacterium]|nr:polysaccharide biosynthesis C-terminal domain-containing protein [bacterium]